MKLLCEVVDGKKISNVDRLSEYEPSSDAVDKSDSSEHDDYVLRRLLKKTGRLTSVLQRQIVCALSKRINSSAE